MLDEGQHAAFIDGWLMRSAKDRVPDVLLQLFEVALAALWARTKTTLGEVTLTAIADRVLYDAAEKFPLFSSLKVEPSSGIQVRELRQQLVSVRASDLEEGFRFVLVQLLTVVGNLTAEVLTPDLHSELERIVLPKNVHARKGMPRIPVGSKDNKRGAKKQ